MRVPPNHAKLRTGQSTTQTPLASSSPKASLPAIPDTPTTFAMRDHPSDPTNFWKRKLAAFLHEHPDKFPSAFDPQLASSQVFLTPTVHHFA